MAQVKVHNKPMLNAYPDSLGGTLMDTANLLKTKAFEDVFSGFYILPSMFNTDLDRGFSVIDYSLNEEMVTEEALEILKGLGIDLKLDFILNHASVLSPQFQDLLKNGQQSDYKDFFINWNTFWEGHGEMTEAGYIQPHQDLIKDMFFRKPGLPILMVKMPEGGYAPYWNTFYQEVKYKEVTAQDLMKLLGIQYNSGLQLSQSIKEQLGAGIRPDHIDFGRFADKKALLVDEIAQGAEYLGQMDLNIKSPLVWDFYEQTLTTLAGYGASVVRLDAFAYGSKEIGKKNFLNDPETWDILERVKQMADRKDVTLLPEIHATYGEKIHELLAEKGYMTYDFFLPGLVIDALENNDATHLLRWANEIVDKDMSVVNMLGCHDGIPLLDLKGILKDEEIQKLIDIVVGRGGHVKNLHGQKNMYYQVNATYYSALGEDDNKMLLARAIQMFMPGKPQVWYLDLFAGTNDHEAVIKAGPNGHKEINRTNLTTEVMTERLDLPIVQKQLELLRMRNTCEAFEAGAVFASEKTIDGMKLIWTNNGVKATLVADLAAYTYTIEVTGV